MADAFKRNVLKVDFLLNYRKTVVADDNKLLKRSYVKRLVAVVARLIKPKEDIVGHLFIRHFWKSGDCYKI